MSEQNYYWHIWARYKGHDRWDYHGARLGDTWEKTVSVWLESYCCWRGGTYQVVSETTLKDGRSGIMEIMTAPSLGNGRCMEVFVEVGWPGDNWQYSTQNG